MVTDPLMQSEGNGIKKLALLFTVPCAILPVLMATAGVLSPPGSPLLFRFDFLLFAAVYLLYGYGLVLSWRVHRKWYAAIVFLVHIAGVLSYLFLERAEWLGYIIVVSILATSIINQYIRVGKATCSVCQLSSKDLLKTP